MLRLVKLYSLLLILLKLRLLVHYEVRFLILLLLLLLLTWWRRIRNKIPPKLRLLINLSSIWINIIIFVGIINQLLLLLLRINIRILIRATLKAIALSWLNALQLRSCLASLCFTLILITAPTAAATSAHVIIYIVI